MTLTEIKSMLAGITPGKWYTVDLPWRPDNMPTWVIAGSNDPHLGKPICDGFHIDEWEVDDPYPDYTQSDKDLTFIAAAPEIVTYLLHEIEIYQKALELCNLSLNHYSRQPPNIEYWLKQAKIN